MEHGEMSFEPQNPLEESTAAQPSVEQSMERLKTYRKIKKSRAMGLCALIAAATAFVFVVIALGSAVISFLNKSLTAAQIRLVLSALKIAGGVCIVAFALSVATFFFKKQRRGFAISALVMSLLVTCGCLAALYAYHYVFGEMKQDDAFNHLSDEDLYMVETDADGHINRESATTPVMDDEKLYAFMEQVQEENPDVEIEWENLTDYQIPDEALAIMNTEKPSGKSYLTGEHEKIENFVLFGLDEIGSSDSIIIFSVDRVHHKLKLISIPRDSYVRVPAFGTYAKLAYPYFWGGAEWAVGTLNHNFSMNISEYIAVDMSQLAQIIDLVGGVYVNLNYDEAWCLRRYADYPTGRNLLHGEAAVSYSRLRESSITDNEQKRTGRQREVLMSVLEQVGQMPWAAYPEFVRSCLGMCATSFENEQLLELCAEVVQNEYTIEQYALIEYVDYWGGILGEAEYFYVVYDLNRASDMLYRIIYEELYISGYGETAN